MIELPVTLTSTGGAVSFASPVPLGYTKNKGVYRLLVTAEGEWEGLTIRCFWHLPGVADPASSLVQDGAVDVPASVTAHPGNGCITFEGSDGVKTVTSADLRYRVGSNSGTEDGTMPEPGTPAWEQLVSETAVAVEAVQKQIGNLDDLTTKAKETLVAAINEAARTGSGGAGSITMRTDGGYIQYSTDDGSTWENLIALDELKGETGKNGADGASGADGYSPTASVEQIADGAKITITDKSGTTEAQVLNGKDGRDGTDGAPGRDGVDGQPGKDGITPTIGDNGNWFLGATDTGKPSRGATGAQGPAGTDGKSAYQYAVDGGYTGAEAEFAAKMAQEQLAGTTNELTPTQVHDAVSAGIPVKVQYTDSTYGLLFFTAFNSAESLNVIVSQTIVYFNGGYILAQLWGNTSKNSWGVQFTTLAQKTDIPSALPNPNTLTFTGAVTGIYDGSAPLSVEIPSGGGSAYELPVASATQLGGVMPVAKTDEMTQAVGVDADGGLWALPGGSLPEEFELVFEDEITEDLQSYKRDVDQDGKPFALSEAAVVILTKPFTDDTKSSARALGLSKDAKWGRTVSDISGSLEKGNIARYDVVHVKVINGYQMRIIRGSSVNATNIFGNINTTFSNTNSFPVSFETNVEKPFAVANVKYPVIDAVAIFGYTSKLIAAGTKIRLYKRKGDGQ